MKLFAKIEPTRLIHLDWVSVKAIKILHCFNSISSLLPGFSFEAGGRTFRPVVFDSMSGTLISMLEGFFYYFILVICFYLSIS